MKVIHFYGLARSGNHAILHWLLHDIAASGRQVIWYNRANSNEYPLTVLSPEATVIYSYEDSEDIPQCSEVLIRDPFNYWASRLKRCRDTGTFIDPFYHRDLWKQYARRATISFNEWYKSTDYRQQIAERLNFSLRDLMLSTFSKENGGSSFKDSKVLDHWKLMRSDRMWQVFFDDEVIELGKSFGIANGFHPRTVPHHR